MHRDNADALFAFSMLIIYFAFASPTAMLSMDVTPPLQEMIQCIHMLQGVRLMIKPIQQWVAQGPLGYILLMDQGNVGSEPTFSDPSTEEHFSKLLIFCSTTPSVNRQTELDDMENFAAAASSLRASFLKAAAGTSDSPNTPAIWRWAVRVSYSFTDRLAERHVVPLVLVAHWCSLMSQLALISVSTWWIEGWVDRNMEEIGSSMPQEYHHWLEWPKKHIQENWEKRRQADANKETLPSDSPSLADW